MSVTPDPSNVEFVDNVPDRHNSFPDSQWLPVLNRVKELPNRPAIVARTTPNEANKLSNNLRAVTKKRGNWKIEQRNGVVYATYLGETQQQEG